MHIEIHGSKYGENGHYCDDEREWTEMDGVENTLARVRYKTTSFVTCCRKYWTSTFEETRGISGYARWLSSGLQPRRNIYSSSRDQMSRMVQIDSCYHYHRRRVLILLRRLDYPFGKVEPDINAFVKSRIFSLFLSEYFFFLFFFFYRFPYYLENSSRIRQG